MNGAQLEAAFDAHKVPILATAGAGVAVLAFLHRKSAAAAADPAAVSSASTGGQLAGATGGGGAYDSTSTDLYGAISPQLGSLAAQLADLQAKLDGGSGPIPVPAPVTPKPAPAPPKALPEPQKPWTPTTHKTFHPVVKPAPAHKVDQWVTIARGQTLSGIAAKYGPNITPTTIARQNGIANPDKVYAGQRIHIVG